MEWYHRTGHCQECLLTPMNRLTKPSEVQTLPSASKREVPLCLYLGA